MTRSGTPALVSPIKSSGSSWRSGGFGLLQPGQDDRFSHTLPLHSQDFLATVSSVGFQAALWDGFSAPVSDQENHEIQQGYNPKGFQRDPPSLAR